MALSVDDLSKLMFNATKPVLKKYWAAVKDLAVTETQKMASTLASITELRIASKIDDQQSQALLEMQKHSMRAVLLAVEGIGLIAAQNAINAALAAVRDTVNKAIGFPLL